VVVKKKRRL